MKIYNVTIKRNTRPDTQFNKDNDQVIEKFTVEAGSPAEAIKIAEEISDSRKNAQDSGCEQYDFEGNICFVTRD